MCYHYYGASEVNKCVTWATAKIDNTQFTIDHTYSFEKFSTVLQYAFTILNINGKNHSDHQMVRKILEKIKVPNNSKINA